MSVKKDDSAFLEPSLKEFEQLYVELRNNEQRIYSDEEVAWLPDIDENHIHRKEWEIRKASSKKLIRYLHHKKKALKILEVGCGNGWLSYHLSQINSSEVIGLDVNLFELQQAERVFAAIPNLTFIYGDIDSSILELKKFDVIVFAAAIQYFRSFNDVIKKALEYLNERGEVHIVDSYFYPETKVKEAEQRSLDYFHNKGFDRMGKFYFHHSLKDLKVFNFSVLYNPDFTFNKILKKKTPFHWICITK